MKDDFLSRWSRRKIAAGKEPAAPETHVAPPAVAPPRPAADAVPVQPQSPEPSPAPLPPIESLTFDSDFAAFMQPGVDAGLRREALKTLLKDPRFNVMDGLDVYIDDYSKPDPIPEGWLGRMYQSNRPNMLMEAAGEPAAAPGPAAELLAKDIQEQPVAPPVGVEAPAASSPQISPPQVGKSPGSPEGEPDVLV